MTLKEQIEKDLKKTFGELKFGDELATVAGSSQDGVDYQCNAAFQLAKTLKDRAERSPIDFAKIIATKFKSKVATAEASGAGFINFTVTDIALTQMASEALKTSKIPLAKQQKRKIFFDYGGANIAKELHVGHLRPPIIGEAMRRTFNAFGHTTIGDTHLGDWGTHMGLIIAELERRGDINETLSLKLLNEIYPQASARKSTDEVFKKRAQDIVMLIQRHEEPYFSIWNEIKKVSLPAIKKNYDRLNCSFDTFEGDNCEYADDMLRILKNTYEDGGCLLMDVRQDGEHVPQTDDAGNVTYKNPMPPVMIKKADGAVLYLTGDLSTIHRRHTRYSPDEYVFVVDARQSLHFTQLFRSAVKGEIVPAATKFVHMALGTMNGQDGKPFKTRAGGTIKLEDVIDLVTEAAAKKLEANGRKGDKSVAEKIGISALKFADLSNHVRRDYIFDIDKFSSFDGKTGPYILYTVARINSILEKANKDEISGTLPFLCRPIVAQILKLSDSYTFATQNYTVNGIIDALYSLANAFNTFYGNTNILKESDTEKRTAYITLCRLVKSVLEFTLNTLAIDTVDKM